MLKADTKATLGPAPGEGVGVYAAQERPPLANPEVIHIHVRRCARRIHLQPFTQRVADCYRRHAGVAVGSPTRVDLLA